MTIVWIAYGLFVGSLIALGARALESVCRIAGRPIRWVWAGALVLMVVLVALAPFRPASMSPPAPPAYRVTMRGSATSAESATPALEMIRYAVATTVPGTIAAVSRGVPASLDRYVAAVWFGLSALLLVLLGVVHARVYRVGR